MTDNNFTGQIYHDAEGNLFITTDKKIFKLDEKSNMATLISK